MRSLLCLIFAMTLLACSDNSSTHDDQSQKTVIDHQIKALEKAKSVEQQILNAADQQRAFIDEQSQ